MGCPWKYVIFSKTVRIFFERGLCMDGWMDELEGPMMQSNFEMRTPSHLPRADKGF